MRSAASVRTSHAFRDDLGMSAAELLTIVIAHRRGEGRWCKPVDHRLEEPRGSGLRTRRWQQRSPSRHDACEAADRPTCSGLNHRPVTAARDDGGSQVHTLLTLRGPHPVRVRDHHAASPSVLHSQPNASSYGVDYFHVRIVRRQGGLNNVSIIDVGGVR